MPRPTVARPLARNDPVGTLRHPARISGTFRQEFLESTRAISYYEAEGGNPAPDIVAKMATALGTTADVLLGLATEAADQPEPATVDERRLWRRFRQLLTLPEKDRRAVLRMLDTMTKARVAG